MLSHARIMVHKLRGSGSRSCHSSEPTPSAPATIAESETANPHAIHISNMRWSPTKLPCKRGEQSMAIIIMDAKGAADYLHLYRLLPRETVNGRMTLQTHVCLALASGLGSRVLPFLATMIAGTGEGEAATLHAEAEAFATQQDCLFVEVSPTTGRGICDAVICDAVSSLVELVYGARDQYTKDQKGYAQRYKRAEALGTLFPS
ncbi:hypothetical protein ALT_7294 [Aspergillus lentulus]|uniref:Uncharacterized protein n=1 Tax=Aspergillus lentulus TaxID=293939 RepID=A0AAN6BQQ4_ASPLE|nr:hypothetical protein CNMCM6069_005599 [Aspergillus lentulus]KAF4167464.1 hypothetical protein CNMCM6936_005080 [Aspergillus lentulus]KAF4176921.1 hypothetical protein CNMCM8060_005854 [Aspergillus lentulus]KAF4186799.1 hypothetical protein CNMCM7927_005039 [Aspergillus lentulus]KAF4196957.1 hypothetical protein CNMCM8694_003977 [Aspergillus lentulus]